MAAAAAVPATSPQPPPACTLAVQHMPRLPGDRQLPGCRPGGGGGRKEHPAAGQRLHRACALATGCYDKMPAPGVLERGPASGAVRVVPRLALSRCGCTLMCLCWSVEARCPRPCLPHPKSWARLARGGTGLSEDAAVLTTGPLPTTGPPAPLALLHSVNSKIVICYTLKPRP